MTTILLLAGCLLDPAARAESPHDHDAHAAAPAAPAWESRLALASPDRVPAGLNPVQNEMLLLTRAMQIAIGSVANHDFASIAPAFHRVHAARAFTEKAVESGAWKPAKGDLASFAAMDDAFHARIEALLADADKKDAAAASAELAAMTQACEGCHATYRF